MESSPALWTAIRHMTDAISEALWGNTPSIYLYGSASRKDFREGWSDIDILVLTPEPILAVQAHMLLTLRRYLEEEQGERLAYAFEGGMLSLGAFLQGATDTVVYWGTSGERISDRYTLNSLSRLDLLEAGVLLAGEEVLDSLPRPAAPELRADIAAHLQTIRDFARFSGRSLYSFGWLLDISRCLYTLRSGGVISKTKAGEWALAQGLCPVPEALELALRVRRSPMEYGKDEAVLTRAESLDPEIQRYADVLEEELRKASS